MALTKELAEFCSALRYDGLPREAIQFIRIGFTDCFATLVAGRFSSPAQILLKTLAPSAGESRLFVDQGCVRSADAAWLNATAAHALDFDDAAQRGHISTCIVPAILAEADACGADGKRMATAYAVGYEVWAELIRREPDHHHTHSWHPTGVFGPVAAAAACASLLGLDAVQTMHALAIGSSQSAGLIANFGTMVKPYHAGRAAHAGVIAARLAAAGFTGALDALEHPKGLLMGISRRARADVATTIEAGREWKLPRDGVNTKKYPNCFASHRALDGMLAIVQEYAITPSLVKRITVTTSRRNKATLRFDSPQDANQARFSMQFSMASAVVAQRCSLLEFVDGFVQRSDVLRLMSLVEVMPEDEEDPRRPGEAPQDVVVLETVDGRSLTRSVSYVRGGPEMPLLPGELFSKFETCLKAGRLAIDPQSLFGALMSIEELPDTATLYQMAAQPTSL